ncbi:hypothetical protein [Streptomyces albidoflavus]|uniref:hypothetical protein n=1 Tax=Streptomyces albidoflavus TaxID=1886 RepID=UPI0010228F72|nr:hypothetical protein [Streptomyces albidoflavus]RZF02946.1 hypothetical protein C0R05_32570 [Streptomyces albidoflavus]
MSTLSTAPLQPVPFGTHHDDNTPAYADLHTHSGILVGTAGSGLTNLTQQMLVPLVNSDDTLVWVLGTSRTADFVRPWLAPWALDHGPEAPADPPLDWVASSEGHSDVLLRAADRIIEARQAEPFGTFPSIVIIAIEPGELPGELLAGLERIQRTGRVSGVRVLSSTALPPVATRGLLRSAHVRISMASVDHERHTSIHQARVPDVDDAEPIQSVAFYRQGAKVRRVRVARMLPQTIDQTARTATKHPAFGPGDLAALGQPYTERWANALPEVFPGAEDAQLHGPL